MKKHCNQFNLDVQEWYNSRFYETTVALLNSLEADDPLPVGSLIGRSGSEASGGGTTLAAVKSGKTGKPTSKKRGSAHA